MKKLIVIATLLSSPAFAQTVVIPWDNDAPIVVDQDGNFLGNTNPDPYDPDSINNPHGIYGSPYQPDSVNFQNFDNEFHEQFEDQDGTEDW